jgi:hypothetical protein
METSYYDAHARKAINLKQVQDQKRRRIRSKRRFLICWIVPTGQILLMGRSGGSDDRRFSRSLNLAPIERQVCQFTRAHALNFRVSQQVSAVIDGRGLGGELLTDEPFHHDFHSPYYCFFHGQIPFYEFSLALHIRTLRQ